MNFLKVVIQFKSKKLLLILVSLLAIACMFALLNKKELPVHSFEIMPAVSLEIYEDSNHTYWPIYVEKRLFFDKETQLSGLIHHNSDTYFDYSTLELTADMTVVVGVANTEEVDQVIFNSIETGTRVEKEIQDQHLFHVALSSIQEHPVIVLKNKEKIYYPYNRK